LYKLSKGEITKEEALNAMGQTTTTAIIAIAVAVEGAALGASLGLVFGPVGAVVGGFVGGVAGGIAGGSIGEAVYEGGKVIVKAAVDTLKNVATSIGDGIKAVGNGLRDLLPSWL
jgi:phage tail tape-measure protein